MIWTGPAPAEQAAQLPSGRSATFVEAMRDPSLPDTARLRFLAPWIAAEPAGVLSDQTMDDMAYLCATYGAPAVGEGAQIIISIADQPVDFGVSAPDVVQVFEAYRVQDGGCIWEIY